MHKDPRTEATDGHRIMTTIGGLLNNKILKNMQIISNNVVRIGLKSKLKY